MGKIHLNLPSDLNESHREALELSCVRGGPDNMPTPTTVVVDAEQLTTVRSVDESGYLSIPMEIQGFGQLMTSTSTLVERERPYSLTVECARGKVNQVRCQADDWRLGGLQVSPLLQQLIREASTKFGQSVTRPPEEAEKAASEALHQGYQAAEELVNAYVQQVFQIRQQRSPKLDTKLSSRIYPSTTGTPKFLRDNPTPCLDALNSVAIPFAWHQVEVEETTFEWKPYDDLLDNALDLGWHVTGGPLVDFSSSQLPGWLWLWEGDMSNISSIMCKYVETVIRRYHDRIKRWVICASPNCAKMLRLSAEDFLSLTYRMLDTAKQIDDSLELVISLGQPWGQHLREDGYRNYQSPYFFVDTLLRAGTNHLSALEIEMVMGVNRRGSYCRDALDASRLLDLYAFLGLPLQVSLGYPSSVEFDPNADPELAVGAGHWREGFTPNAQADWANYFVKLALAKPFVQSVQWMHLSDDQPHLFPNLGLLDAEGNARPVLSTLQEIREARLR